MKHILLLFTLFINLWASNIDFNIFSDIRIYENEKQQEFILYNKEVGAEGSSVINFYSLLRKKYENKKVKEFTISYELNKYIKTRTVYLSIISDYKHYYLQKKFFF